MVCKGHKKNFELVGFHDEWFFLEQLDAGLPKFDPIWCGIINGPY